MMDSELLDERAIRNVVLAYCRGVDRMDRALVRSCYHDDAREEHGSFEGPIDDYLEWVWRVLARYDRTMHLVANQLVELRGDRAHCETYGIAFHEGDPADPTKNLTTGFRYLDRFERRNGDWRIVQRVAVTDWCRSWAPETRWEIPGHLLVGARGSADPLYESRAWLDG
jgi:hypothetical protein